MFRKKTVFILGAGASTHYGYPTGEKLVEQVIKLAGDAATYFSSALTERNQIELNVRPRVITRNSPQQVSTDQVQNEWKTASEEFQALTDRLRAAHPLVIDYFLDHNPDFEAVGKFCIAWALLHAESNFRDHHQKNLNAENWLRFIL